MCTCEASAALLGPMLEIQHRDDRWLPAKIVDTVRHQLAALSDRFLVAAHVPEDPGQLALSFGVARLQGQRPLVGLAGQLNDEGRGALKEHLYRLQHEPPGIHGVERHGRDRNPRLLAQTSGLRRRGSPPSHAGLHCRAGVWPCTTTLPKDPA